MYDELKASQVQQLQLRLNAPTETREALSEATCNRILAILETMGQAALRLDVVPSNEAYSKRAGASNRMELELGASASGNTEVLIILRAMSQDQGSEGLHGCWRSPAERPSQP